MNNIVYPKITFTITTFNRLNLFVRTMDSFLQTCLDKDLIADWIIGDDGSSEKDIKFMLNKYPFFELYRNPKKGQASNINNLFSKIRTEWFFHCFKGATLIETIGGCKKIKDININDLVKTHKNRFKKVTKIYKRKLRQHSKLIWIRTKYSIFKVTPKHPFLVLRDKNIDWIEAKDILDSDFLLYPKNNKENYVEFNCKSRYLSYIKFLIDRDFARFFGLYLAKGHSNIDSICFTFNNKEKYLHDFIETFCINKFNRKPNKYKTHATQLRLCIKSFSSLFKNWFGTKANKKKIPKFIFEWNLINKLSFIKGYIEGNGHIYKNGHVVIVTASKILVKDFIKLCNSCGLNIKLETRKPSISYIKNKIIRGKITYALGFNKNEFSKMMDILESKELENFYAIKIISIEDKKQASGIDMNIYNLEVEGDNSYIANSAIVHNCEDDWLFIRTDNYIRKLFNIVFDDPMIKNVTLRYWTGNEIVSKNDPNLKYNLHYYNPKEIKEVAEKKDSYWCGYTLNPSIQHLPTIKELGKYNEDMPIHNREWDRTVAIRYYEKGYKRANLTEKYIEHIGDKSAYLFRGSSF